MKLPSLPTILSLTTGALVLSLATANADGYNGIDASKLLIFNEDLGVAHEDWVSTDPLETHAIKKIEGGRVSYVSVIRTATGTYSSDGIASPNVQYPGIIAPAKPRNQFSFSSWNNGQWTTMSTYNCDSYVSVSTYEPRRGETRTSTCISTASFWYC
jgi:hypothetical protein